VSWNELCQAKADPVTSGPAASKVRRLLSLSAQSSSPGLKQAIADQRKVWDLLDQMNQITLHYMWKNIPGTTRRKKLSNKTLGLN
jgi:hypothetical protein